MYRFKEASGFDFEYSSNIQLRLKTRVSMRLTYGMRGIFLSVIPSLLSSYLPNDREAKSSYFRGGKEKGKQ